jgi:hypothetical protein
LTKACIKIVFRISNEKLTTGKQKNIKGKCENEKPTWFSLFFSMPFQKISLNTKDYSHLKNLERETAVPL